MSYNTCVLFLESWGPDMTFYLSLAHCFVSSCLCYSIYVAVVSLFSDSFVSLLH